MHSACITSVLCKPLVLGGIAATLCALASVYALQRKQGCKSKVKSIPDQPLRFALAKQEGNKRMLDIDSVYNPSLLKGRTVLVTGAKLFIYASIRKRMK